MARVNQQSTTLDPAVTRSYQYFGELVGKKPHVAKAILVRNPQLTITMLTEVLGNMFEKKKTRNRQTPIKALEHRHFIKTHDIPLVRFTEDMTTDLANGVEGECYMDKKYYSPRDVFKLRNEQQLKVTREPIMVAPNKWKHYVKVWGNNPSERINTSYTTKGCETQYISNYHPELSERGYDKYMYNIEEHANYISLHRHGMSESQLWGLIGDHIMQHNGEYFKISEDEKRLVELFYLSRERSLTFGKSTMDLNGKCTQFEDDGRPIITGDGIYEQYKKYCTLDFYTELQRYMLDDSIAAVVAKCPEKIGNRIMCITGYDGYQNVGRLLETIIGAKSENGYFYTKQGDKVKIGAEFTTYTFQGNELVFTYNKAYDLELSDFDSNGKSLKSQELLFFDVTQREGTMNAESGEVERTAPIEMITLEGGAMITGTLKGMGGRSGRESGIDIATTVAGSRFEVMGYAGAVVQDPYTAHILKKAAA